MNFNLDFKALAYAAPYSSSELVSPCPCALVFRCDAGRKQATLVLVAKFPTSHATDTTFMLKYHADSLLPGTVSLSSGSDDMSQAQLEDIMRDKSNKHSDIKTLKLSLAQPCPLWCPDTTQPFSPKAGHESAFQQFAALAKATTIHIVFDYKYVRKEHRGMFKAFSKAASGLAGFPFQASRVGRALRKATWEVLGPGETAGAPPAYDDSRTRKRPRQVSPSSPVRPSKRLPPHSPTALDSPEPRSSDSHTSDKTIPFSPETAAAALARALRRPSPGYDFQTEAINAAIERQLPAYINRAQPQRLQNDAIEVAVAERLPVLVHAALQTEAIEAAVSKQLDTFVRALLPNALEDLLTSKSTPSSPATSFTSIDSRGNKYPRLPRPSRVARMMIPELRTHLNEEFQKHQAEQLQRFEQAVDKTLHELEMTAYDDRARERAEFDDELEEHKTDVSILKRDVIDTLWRETEDVFVQAREEGSALGEDINDRLAGLCDKIERIKRVRLRKMVMSELSRQSSRKKRIPKGVGKTPVRAHQSLLGRRREPEDVEWVDC